MFRKSLYLTLIFALLLGACASATEAPVVPTEPKQQEPQPTAYPDVIGAPVQPYNPYPEPIGENQMITEYAPLPGDEKWSRGNVYLEIEQSSIVMAESFPVQVSLTLSGSLPTPCHQLRVIVSEPDAENKINVEVYSVVDPEVMCITVLAPFTSRVELGSYESGHYEVYVNGELMGEFDL